MPTTETILKIYEKPNKILKNRKFYFSNIENYKEILRFQKFYEINSKNTIIQKRLNFH